MFTFGTDQRDERDESITINTLNYNTGTGGDFIKVIDESYTHPFQSTKNGKLKPTLQLPDSASNSCFNFEEEGSKEEVQSMLFTANNSTCEYLHSMLRTGTPSNTQLLKRAASPVNGGARPLFNFSNKLQSAQQQ